jgi:kynurenine formamidase
MRIVDLTHTIRPAHWRWGPRLTHRSTHAGGGPFQVGVLETTLHAYTHVDAPLHFVPGGASIDRVPLDLWAGEATVVDLSDLAPERGGVRPEHLEARAGRVRPGDIVLLRTDWDRRVDVESEAFWRDAPYTTRGAAEWLAGRGVKTVGYDFPPDECLSSGVAHPERLPREAHTTHDVFLPRGIGVVEYLAHLADVRRERFLFVALPLKLSGGDGSPARAVALEL